MRENSEVRLVEESLLQIVLFCGWPRAIATLAVAWSLLGPHELAGESLPLCGRSPQTLEADYRHTPDPIRAELGA